MPYAQINYPETLGTGPKAVSIHAAGCFLDAFCNLLERFGKPVDPPTLNQFFINNNDYLRESDGTVDLLSWGSVTAYDPNIRIVASGNGAPSSNDSIVKFVYNGGTTHFCLVIDAAAGTILDSWDGKVKNWSVYGGPVAYASYTNAAPSAATTAKPAVSPAAVLSSSTGKQLILPGSVSEWHVYKPGGPYNLAAAIAVLDPAKFGGLTYDILGSPATNFYLIQTADFGEVAIYAGPDTVAQIVDKAAPAPTPAPAAPATDPDVTEVTVQPGWGVTSVLAAAGYPRASQENEAEWDRLAALNGSATRLKFTPGEVVKVNKTPLAIPAPANPTPVQPANITDVTEDVTITDTLRVRSGPSTQDSQVAVDGAPNGDLQKDDIVGITGYCHGESINGNDIWLRSVKGNWFWSGATTFTVAQLDTVANVTPTPAAPEATPAAGTPPVVMPPAPAAATPAVETSTAGDNVPVKVTTTTTVGDLQITPAPGLYVSKFDTFVTDLAGKNKPIPLKVGTIFQSAEEIVQAGKIYLRDVSAKKKDIMYVALKKDLKSAGASLDGMVQFAKDMKQASEDDWDEILDQLRNENEAPQIVRTIEKDAVKVEKGLFGLFNKKGK